MDMPSTSVPQGDAEPVAFEATPTPRPRRDGWTVERQKTFIRTLAETGDATFAARTVGLSRESAYSLAAKPYARAFARAWDEALLVAHRVLVGIGLDYVIHGTVETIWKDGECIGERRRPSERLHIFLLKHLDPRRVDPPRRDHEMEGEPLGLPASEVSLLMWEFEDDEEDGGAAPGDHAGEESRGLPHAHARPRKA